MKYFNLNKLRYCIFALMACLLLSCKEKDQLIITDVGDIDGIRIGAMMGTTHVDYIKNDFPNAHTFTYDNLADLYHALRTNKVDVVAIDAFVWFENSDENQDIVAIDEHWHDEPFGVIFNKSNTELLKQYNAFLAEIRESGELQEVIDKWLSDGDNAQMPDLSHIPRSGQPLRVGCTGIVAFFDFVRDGENCGLDIELIQRFAAYLGRPIEFSMMNFGGLVAATSSNVVDIATSSICITEERAKQVNFSDSYCSGYSALVIRKENAAPVANDKAIIDVDNLGDAKIGAVMGTSYVGYITNDFPGKKVSVYDNYADVYHALKTRNVDVIATGDLNWKQVCDQYPEFGILNDHWHKEPYGAIFSKSNQELLNQYNEFLAEIRESGLLQEIIDKWLSGGSDTKMPDLSNVKRSGEPIKVGCTGTVAFFDFVRNGENCGMDIELMQRFAAHLGRPIEFSMMNFGGLIAATSSGIIDIGTCSICITEERAKQVNFGDSYFSGYGILVARNENLSHAAIEDVVVEEKSMWDSICDRFYDNLVKEDRWKLILNGLWNTVLISIMSILLGTIVGVGVCALRMSKLSVCQAIAKGYINLVRGIPVLVLLMILFYVVFAQIGMNAVIVAIIAFALNFAAYVSEMFRSGLEGIDVGQKKAGIAMGFTNFQTFRYIVLPQTVKRVLPVFKGESISLVKTTSVVGYIAVADLTKASDIIRSRTFDAFFPLIVITIIYFILAWLLGKALDLIGKTSK